MKTNMTPQRRRCSNPFSSILQMGKPLDAGRVLYRQEKYDTCLREAQQALSQSHGSQPELNC